jgi:Flp pilus assembly pilin Flp
VAHYAGDSRPQPRLSSDTRGLATIEYLLLACVIAVVGLAVWSGLGETVQARVEGVRAVLAEEGAGIAPAGSASLAVGSRSGASTGGRGAASTSRRAGAGADDGWLGRGTSSTTGGRIARGVADGLADVASGAVDGAVAIGSAAVALARDPGRARAAIGEAAADPGATARAALEGAAGAVSGLAESAVDGARRFASGDAYTRARMLTGAAATAVPVGAAANLARGAGAVARATSAANRVGVTPGRRLTAAEAHAAAAANRVGGRDAIAGTREIPGARGYVLAAERDRLLIGPGSGVSGRALNLTDDVYMVAEPGAFTVSAHAQRGAVSFGDGAGRELAPRQVAGAMIDHGYRGGDVVMMSCESACSSLPRSLRSELDSMLEARGERGRVGTIAAPTETVTGTGHVDRGGHWRLFDSDTPEHPGPATQPTSARPSTPPAE